MVKAEYIIAAYGDCRKGKASSPDAIRFETYLFENITDLVERINSRTYEPMPSITFVVSRPVYREVFAANFRDRVIHHYIALRLEPLFEGVFSDRTYNCRCGKGQLYGVRQLAEDIKECSENFTKPCWYLKCDMKGFFMSIPREELADKVDAFILDNYKGDDIEDLRYLSRVTIMNDPTKNCIKRSSEETMAKVPLGKTLRGAKKNHGLPIGNLTSQHDANFWLNAMTGLGLATEEKPYYNDYALYVAMNQVVSDHGCTIAKILGKEDVKEIDTEHLVKYANHLALDLLKDKDGVYDIREYFLK